MSKRILLFLLIASVACTSPEGGSQKDTQDKPATNTKPVAWTEWSEGIFAQAKKEKKLVLLDLGAVWCHWCHVMDEKTYSDPQVAAYMNEHFVAAKVDQDAHPDLASRYHDWGWPATILLDADGQELAKFSGYMPKPLFMARLRAFVEEPTPGPSVRAEPKLKAVKNSSLDKTLKARLNALYRMSYDDKEKGWGFGQKWMDWNMVEYGMELALDGTKDGQQMARETLDKQQLLLDPIWGGVYQYSHGKVWTNPHYEKLTIFQAHNIRTFALASILWNKDQDLKAAKDIFAYTQNFLKSPEGAYYTSQDADLIKGEHSETYFNGNDAERRKQGIPAVDKNIYSQENGLLIEAFSTLYAATGDNKYLTAAETAARWIIENRGVAGGGFRHGEKADKGGPFLADNLHMGQGLLILAQVTGKEEWLQRAEKCGQFMVKHLKGELGFLSHPLSKKAVGVFAKPVVRRGENIVMARFLNLLAAATGNKSFKQSAAHAMAYLLIPKIANQQRTAGTLLADREFSTEAPHIVIVGSRTDENAKALFQAALRLPSRYKVVEWQDPAENKKSRSGQSFPKMDKAAVFICAGTRCSVPVFEKEALFKALERLGFPMRLKK